MLSLDPADRVSAFAKRPEWIRLIVPAGTLALIAFASFVLPTLASLPPPSGGSVLDANLPLFSSGHVLGTDMIGNDNLSRLLYGGRTSIQIALAVNAIGLILGGALGALSAYVGRLVDAFIMRVLDAFIAFPSLILVLAVAQGLGGGLFNTIWSLAFFSVPAFARVARSATLQLRTRPFVAAAVLSGARPTRLLLHHIAPNIAPQLVAFALLGMGIVIVLEGALSFLGLGIQPPEPSWGNMIAQGQQVLLVRPMLVLLPSAALFVTVLSCNVLGETARELWRTP